MDSVDLIARENEFKKLNKQLEKRTESLMKEIEYVMQKQDIFKELSQNINIGTAKGRNPIKHSCDTETPNSTPTKQDSVTRPHSTPKKVNNHVENLKNNTQSSKVNEISENGSKRTTVACNCCLISKNSRLDNDVEFLYAFVSVSVQDKVLPQSFLKDGVSMENVCKFLSSKVKLLQEQIDKLQNTLNKKSSQCERHLTSQAELESEKLSLMNKANSLRAETADVKAKFQALQNRFNEKDRLYKEQRSETDKIAAEVKRLRSKNISVEARCASQEQLIENLKQQLEAVKRSEKEFRDSSRALSSSHEGAIQRLEARVARLKSFGDKQAELIDNLRRQNALLATDGVVKELETEYCKFLTQD